MRLFEEETKKIVRSRFQRHVSSLIWKCWLQRIRRWRLLLAETLFAAALLIIALFLAKPVFLTSLKEEMEPPLTSIDILASLRSRTNILLGYAPNTGEFVTIMTRAAELLQKDIIPAASEDDLINILYLMSGGTPLTFPAMFVIFSNKKRNVWRFSIRSTERARHVSGAGDDQHNPHLRAGFLAMQAAVSQAIIEHASPTVPRLQVSLVSMPVSPLMLEYSVRRANSGILLCLTLALLPPVVDAQMLVVKETVNRLKRGFRIRHVDFSTQYIAWLVYAYLTALPICVLVSLLLIFIFRWIHMLIPMIIILAYVSVMIMIALIMGMFNSTAWIASLWTVLFTLLNTFLAEMLVHHEYDQKHIVLTFIMHMVLPPLGLVHALNEFAMLQTGRGAYVNTQPSLVYTIISWSMMNLLYFVILMILQRTIKAEAIGGAVSWKSIVFKKVEDTNKLRPIKTPTGQERAMLQEVDDLMAKAISFQTCSKTIMDVPILNKVTFDIYRGEFTMLFAERVQEQMLVCIEDLLTGLTLPDEGTITVLGHTLSSDISLVAMPYMMGYCHDLKFLMNELTVEEHLVLFTEICLWYESTQFWAEYLQIRTKRIYAECDLEAVKDIQVRKLGGYYRAQLCWAIALLIEPRIIFIPHLADEPIYNRVIKDKIMRYKKYMTIVMLSRSSIHLDFCDRVFIFDSKVLVYGGTPAYMFFKYGREYRVRMTFRGSYSQDHEIIAELLRQASFAGASVRAHLGSLLILKLPSSPTASAAKFVQHLTDNAVKYGIISMSISLPDTEEVTRRAINVYRSATHQYSAEHHNLCQDALRRIGEPQRWRRKYTYGLNASQLRKFLTKYFYFYRFHKIFLIVMALATLVAGIVIGVSLSYILAHLDKNKDAYKIAHNKLLTIEALSQKTTIVVKLDDSVDAVSVANAYVLSDTGATDKEIKGMKYSALGEGESMTEYLITRAIDSPQHYVYMYAYGIQVTSNNETGLMAEARYSPLHHDEGAAARSLARVYMALLRHYTGALDASIQVTDDPLTLDLTPWMKYVGKAPLLIQFLLILTISHITLMPSKEHGLARHMQCNAKNFSPARYWFTMFFCDLMLYWIQVLIMTCALISIVFIIVPSVEFSYADLGIVPILLFVYGFGCIPQAYLFSIGPRTSLNVMSFVIVNLVFGETTVIAKVFYGEALHYALYFMRLSPQFNLAYAYVKIKQIFLYNSECVFFKSRNLCNTTNLHKCCDKCGILQECFKRKRYFTMQPGILGEIIAIFGTACLFTIILMLWEYRLFQRLFRFVMTKITYTVVEEDTDEAEGLKRERADVIDKMWDIRHNRRERVDTFGEYLLAENVCKKEMGYFLLRNISFGIGKGEVLALSGLKRHGRAKLCEILSGYKIPSSGSMWSMSQYSLKPQPYHYSSNIALCCNSRSPLPSWMRVGDALALLGLLRGVPKKHLAAELNDYIEALDLVDDVNKLVYQLGPNASTRLHFAAAVIGAPPVLIIDECTAYQKYSVRRAMYSILYTLKKRGHAIFISSSRIGWRRTHSSTRLHFAAAVIGAPPVLIIDECTAYQKYSVRRAMYSILYTLKKRGHAIFISSSSTRLHFAAAVIGAPPVLIIDECTAYQKYSVRRAMYSKLYTLKKREHAIFISFSSVEAILPITSRLAILVDGGLYDIDHLDRLVARHSQHGYTVVVHLKDEVDISNMFSKHFHNIIINDVSDVLANVQVLDDNLDWGQMFGKMEKLLEQNPQVYSYIITAIPIDYIYNSIISKEQGLRPTSELISVACVTKLCAQRVLKEPTKEVVDKLIPFESKYSIIKLKELPWSVIFRR